MNIDDHEHDDDKEEEERENQKSLFLSLTLTSSLLIILMTPIQQKSIVLFSNITIYSFSYRLLLT